MNINDSFGYIINLTARNMKKKLEADVKKYDITIPQWTVLKVLSEEDNLTQAEVAERLSADRATTGAVIEKLIDKKLIDKNQCKNDRRAYRVCISAYGVNLAGKISCEAVNCNNKALDGFKKEEIEQLVNYLHKINNNLNKEE